MNRLNKTNRSDMDPAHLTYQLLFRKNIEREMAKRKDIVIEYINRRHKLTNRACKVFSKLKK